MSDGLRLGESSNLSASFAALLGLCLLAAWLASRKRVAPAVERSPERDDFSRALSPAGVQKFTFAARGLAALGFHVAIRRAPPPRQHGSRTKTCSTNSAGGSSRPARRSSRAA